MGYQTSYSLTQVRNPIHAAQLSAAILLNEESAYALSSDGSTSEESKWYEHDAFMVELSAMYPVTIFKLHGEGEGTGDIWDKYYSGGKLQHTEELKTELPVPDLDKMVPSEEFFAKRRIVRIHELLSVRNLDFEVPKYPGVYLAIEYGDGGIDLAAYNANSLELITTELNLSETTGVESVNVYNLDTDEILAVRWVVDHYISETSGFRISADGALYSEVTK